MARLSYRTRSPSMREGTSPRGLRARNSGVFRNPLRGWRGAHADGGQRLGRRDRCASRADGAAGGDAASTAKCAAHAPAPASLPPTLSPGGANKWNRWRRQCAAGPGPRPAARGKASRGRLMMAGKGGQSDRRKRRPSPPRRPRDLTNRTARASRQSPRPSRAAPRTLARQGGCGAGAGDGSAEGEAGGAWSRTDRGPI